MKEKSIFKVPDMSVICGGCEFWSGHDCTHVDPDNGCPFDSKKALEIACEHIYSGRCAHCPLRDLDCANDLPCEQSIKLYFLAQAKAGDRP